MVGVAAAGLIGGCADLSSKTDLPNEAKVEQVMVTTPGPNSAITTPFNCSEFDKDGNCQDPLVDAVGSNFEITFGSQPDYNLCGFDASEQRLGDCPPTAEGVALHCALTGPHKGHCVAGDEKPPVVGHADPSGLQIRLVLGKLLNGQTVEEFACACQGTDLTMIDPMNCSSGEAWSKDPNNCSACGGSAAEQGKCLDTDANGLPDVLALIPNVVSVTCGTFITGTAGNNGLSEGRYYPSGNQFLSSVLGLPGMGPALEYWPSIDLPTDEDCTVAIDPSVKTKDGESIDQTNGPFKFHTDHLGLVETSPAAGATVDPAKTTKITVTFNSSIKSDTATATSFVVAEMGGATITGTTFKVAGPTVTITLPAALSAGKTYTVTVKGSVADTYGKTLGADQDPISFKTQAAM